MNDKRYDFIISTIKEAGDKALKSKDNHLEISIKDGDPRNILTNVDIEVNEYITNSIRVHFPNETIYSEEAADENISLGSFWSIDPIDGTANFARSIPHYAVVIAYVDKGVPIVGAVYNPITNELFSFKKDKGAFLNGKPIHVSEIKWRFFVPILSGCFIICACPPIIWINAFSHFIHVSETKLCVPISICIQLL